MTANSNFRPTENQRIVLDRMARGATIVLTRYTETSLEWMLVGAGLPNTIVPDAMLTALLRADAIQLAERRVDTPDHYNLTAVGRAAVQRSNRRPTESDAYCAIVEHLPALRDALEDIAAALISLDSMAQRLMAANDAPYPVGVWGEEEPAVRP